jgi:hypothetical protein
MLVTGGSGVPRVPSQEGSSPSVSAVTRHLPTFVKLPLMQFFPLRTVSSHSAGRYRAGIDGLRAIAVGRYSTLS